jgi:non-specific serine/threonine protein kinase
LNNLANLAADRGDLGQAIAWYEEALAIFCEIGEEAGVAMVLHNLADAHDDRGDRARAIELFRESMLLHRELGRPAMVALDLRAIASFALRSDRDEQATRLFAASAALLASLGEVLPAHQGAEIEEETESARKRLGPERFSAAWDAGTSLPLDLAIAEALAVSPPTHGSDVPSRQDILPVPAENQGVALPPAIAEIGLSPREIEVLRLVSEGQSNKEIAEALFIAPRTASTHVANILTKLGVESRSAATAWAFRHGLIQDTPDAATP